MRAALALAGFILAAGPARADDGAAIDRLLNFAVKGCIASATDGASLAAFAAKERAQSADENTARAFLGADKGTVYLKQNPDSPVALTQRAGSICTVNARFPGDLAPVIEVVDDYFTGPGGRFYPGRIFEEASAHGGWVTHRVYLGERAGKQITILFSTDPKAPALGQIAVTVAAEKKSRAAPSSP